MKNHLIAILFVFSMLSSSAQKEANFWYFGYGAGLNFNSGSPVQLNGAMNTLEGCSSIADKTTGQSLFYTDGSTVYNRNNVIMTNGTGLLGNYSATQSAVIVPQPGSNTLYYIFTADAQVGYNTHNAGKFCYNVVDMSLSGGLGSVTVKNQVLADSMVEKIAAYPHCNGRDVWVVAHQWDSNAFYSYLLTDSGIYSHTVSYSGVVHKDMGSGMNAEAIGYMKISPDGTMLGLACAYNLHTVQVFPFDNTTGIIGAPLLTDSNTWTMDQTKGGPYGLTFSPDSRLLYVSVVAGYNVYQYDMTAGNSAAILATKWQVGRATQSENFGALQIAPDGKIYIAECQISILGVINHPNTLGPGCNFAETGVVLAGTSGFGLPDMLESYLIPQYTATLSYNACGSNNTLALTDSTINGAITCQWDFGDTLSGSSDSSTLKNPTHVFASFGIHTVKLYVTNLCRTDTLTRIINITGVPVNATVTPTDTAFCQNNFIQLQASGGTSYKWSPTIGLSDPNIANPIAYPTVTTTYTVTVSPVFCADSTATVHILVYPTPPVPSITQSHDTLLCSSDSTYSSYQWYVDSVVIPGGTKSFLVYSKGGNYNVQVTNSNGCSIAVGINVVGIKEFSVFDSDFSISPNPAITSLQLAIGSLQSGNSKLQIYIYNVLGKAVQQSEIKNPQSEIKLDVFSIPPGIYFVQIISDKQRWVRRFVKE